MSHVSYDNPARAIRFSERDGLVNRRHNLMIEVDEIGVELQEIGRDLRPEGATDIQLACEDIKRKVARLKKIGSDIHELDDMLKDLS